MMTNPAKGRTRLQGLRKRWLLNTIAPVFVLLTVLVCILIALLCLRSDERRVGQECRR